ncbi:hypothetical protein LINGRAHAP2_LOCUS3682 [Linum grandiflorum]
MSSLCIGSSISNESESGSPDLKKLQIKEDLKFDDFKDADMCGLLFADSNSSVTVGLMNLKSDEQQFRKISVAFPKNLITRPSSCWAFTVVESKLFATGGRAHETYYCGYGRPVLEVYFCDLRDVVTTNNNSDESLLEFKVATTLNCPKTSPLVVPYKDKIFFIANPCAQVEEEEHSLVANTPCEVLYLGDGEFNVKPLTSSMFWQGGHDLWRKHTGHVVVRNKLYVRVVSGNKVLPTLYCLDMDAEVWEAEYCIRIPQIVKELYQYEDERPWNYVHGDKHLFKLEMDVEDPSVFCFSVEILNEDDDGDVSKVKVDLKGVVDSMGLEGHCYIYDGWVLPCGEKTSDVFCLMFWILGWRDDSDYYLGLCKFKLADDGSFNILTRRAIYVPIPMIIGMVKIGFTPGISKALNIGEYSNELVKRDRELKRRKKRKERKEGRINEAQIEEAKRDQYAKRELPVELYKRYVDEEPIWEAKLWSESKKESEEAIVCDSEVETIVSEEESIAILKAIFGC